MSSKYPEGPRVLAIGMDAADATLALRWANEGRLPTLQGLIRAGSTARLRSIADRFPDPIWPTISTGCLPGKHGHYNFRCVRPGSYEMVYSPDRSYRRPFWWLLRREGVAPGNGYRLLLVDVPKTAPLGDDAVTELIGWGERGALRHRSWPPGLFDEMVARYGRYPRWLNDDIVRRSVRGERHYLRTLQRMIDARTALLRDLLRERPWDFCLACFPDTHNAGHVFFRYTRPGTWAYNERHAAQFGDALLRIYRQVDQSIGELIAAAPSGTDVVIFAGHGFRLNTNGLRLLPRLLTALGYHVPRQASVLSGVLNAARAFIPWSIRRHVNARLSLVTRTRIMTRMWVEGTDWSRTRAVAEAEFGQSWVRVNLRGREPEGTVEPGAEYDALCAEIAGELSSLTNAETGAPAVSEVTRVDTIVEGPHAHEIPDLIVRWSPDELVRAVRHPRLGVFNENLMDISPSEHSGKAFLIAAGPHIRPGATVEGGHIIDIAPTLLYLMRAPIPDDMDGEVLRDIIDPSELASRPVRREAIEWADDPWGDG